MGLQANTDLLILYLTQGHVGVTFIRDSSGLNPGVTLTSSSLYNDTLLHHVQVVFSSGQFKLIVDGQDRQLMEGIAVREYYVYDYNKKRAINSKKEFYNGM